jgi:hypothetical protein
VNYCKNVLAAVYSLRTCTALRRLWTRLAGTFWIDDSHVLYTCQRCARAYSWDSPMKVDKRKTLVHNMEED